MVENRNDFQKQEVVLNKNHSAFLFLPHYCEWRPLQKSTYFNVFTTDTINLDLMQINLQVVSGWVTQSFPRPTHTLL